MRYKHFTQDKRNEISILLKRGYSHREIASVLGKNHSSVSREIKRNSVLGIYHSQKAHHKAYVKRKYSKYQGMKIRENPELEEYLKKKIRLSWSPESIAGRLNLEKKLSVHHTTIYKYLYSIYGQALCKHLRYKHYRKKRRKAVKSKSEIIKNRIFIDHRPKIINEKRRFFDFEGDVLGAPAYLKEKIIGLIDRKSRYILAKKIRQLRYAIDGFKNLLKCLPVNSVTFDNGPENARHQELKTKTYFCHPYSSWEKGAVENAFGLLREYIPKRVDLKDYSNEDISAILEIINSRPRKCLGFRTPQEVFKEQLLKHRCCTSG